ncbi:MAG: hypothetical protein WCT77_02000 [Bacteroidota bacterium]|jgi:hypothetical protein
MDNSTREIANQIAFEITKLPNVKSAYVDDYHEHSGIVDFQVVAILEVHQGGGGRFCRYWPDNDYTTFNLRPTSNGIRKILNTNKHITGGKSVEVPKRMYSWNGYTNDFDGYERNYIMVDFIIRD